MKGRELLKPLLRIVTILLGLSVLVLLVPMDGRSANGNLKPGSGRGELFLVGLPEPTGWKIGFQKQERKGIVDLVHTEYVPETQSVEDWHEMVTVQIYRGLKKVRVEEWTKEWTVRMNKSCQGGVSPFVKAQMENGYAAAFSTHYCPMDLQTGKGEITYIKAVVGKDSFYVVLRAWRGESFSPDNAPMTRDTALEWSRYMSRVSVCDTRDPQRACPQGIQ